MQRIVVHRPGGYGRLVLEEHPDPAPGPGEVLVEVRAAGVNFADCAVRMGLYSSAREFVGWPITPGFDVAGRVLAAGEEAGAPSASGELVARAATDARAGRAATGERVASAAAGERAGAPGGARAPAASAAPRPPLAAGARVLGVTRFGGYASRVALPASQVFPAPAGWSDAQAGAFPTVHLTAWYALRRMLDARPGMRVLVHSAAGGVGTAALALGRAFGLRCAGVVRGAHKVEVARAAGAELVVDAERGDPWPALARAAPAGFDGILDANGVATLRASWRHLAPEGRLVTFGFATMLARGSASGRAPWPRLALARLRTPRFDPLALVRENKSVMGFNLSYLFHRADALAAAMDELLALAASGRLPPPRVEELPLARAAEAHRRLQSGATTGKLVLVP